MLVGLAQQYAGEGLSTYEALAKAATEMPERIKAEQQKRQSPVPRPTQLVSLQQFSQMGENVAYLEGVSVNKLKA